MSSSLISAARLIMYFVVPSQTPVRSGLPSGRRGVGAVRSGLPSAVRGVPFVGYLSHCAGATLASAQIVKTRNVDLCQYRERPGIANPPFTLKNYILSGLQRA